MSNLELKPDNKFISKQKNGRFEIPWQGFSLPSFRRFLKYRCSKSESNIPPTSKELDSVLPIVKPEEEHLLKARDDAIQATWFGHATVLLQMEGINILTDPIFSEYAGPLQSWPFVKRYRKVPLTVDEIPVKIDAVVISHNHYDHLDETSVRQLVTKYQNIAWFVPLGLRDWMKSVGCTDVRELDWWQEERLNESTDVKFVFTPAQHWCQRGPWDRNKVLWGGWCVIGKHKRFYFAGDTGYCHDGLFKEIGRLYKPFDLAAIPIGAYCPRDYMKNKHIDPDEAFEIHKEIGAKKSFGIHWATFNLTHEFYLEPRERIANIAENIKEKSFVTLNIGETIEA